MRRVSRSKIKTVPEDDSYFIGGIVDLPAYISLQNYDIRTAAIIRSITRVCKHVFIRKVLKNDDSLYRCVLFHLLNTGDFQKLDDIKRFILRAQILFEESEHEDKETAECVACIENILGTLISEKTQGDKLNVIYGAMNDLQMGPLLVKFIKHFTAAYVKVRRSDYMNFVEEGESDFNSYVRKNIEASDTKPQEIVMQAMVSAFKFVLEVYTVREDSKEVEAYKIGEVGPVLRVLSVLEVYQILYFKDLHE